MTDKRALRVLFDRYWTTGGWRSEDDRRTSADDLAYAIDAGVMFEEFRPSHDSLVGRLVDLVSRVGKTAAANGFVTSLTNRRLDVRSALGSFAVFRRLERHSGPKNAGRCESCGGSHLELIDLNVLNFERFKWGGVRHDHVEYAVLDLEQFIKAPPPEPSNADVEAFRALVARIRECPSGMTAARLESALAGAIRSNKSEREIIIAVLGFCGVLRTPGHANYRESFQPPASRQIPNRRFVDMPYPACWWVKEYGLDDDALADYFGHVL